MAIGRALFRAAVPSFIQQGFSANRMIDFARLSGWSYRRMDMLGDIREFTGLMRQEKKVRTVKPYVKPSRGVMVETDLRSARRYRVFMDVEYEDRITGETETRVASMYSDTLGTPDEWEMEYTRAYEETEYDPDRRIKAFQLRAIEHNRGFSY